MSKAAREARGLLAGVLIILSLHCLFVIVITPIATELFEPKNSANYLRGIASLIYTVSSLGLSQLLYAVPLGLWLKQKGKQATLKGVVATCAITALLSSACFVSFWV